MNPLDLIGKRVRYEEGREGHVRSVHAGKDRPPELRIMLRVPVGEPDRVVDAAGFRSGTRSRSCGADAVLTTFQGAALMPERGDARRSSGEC